MPRDVMRFNQVFRWPSGSAVGLATVQSIRVWTAFVQHEEPVVGVTHDRLFML